MGYLIQQMWFCLLLAAILGAIIGWLLKSLFYRNQIDELEATWRSKCDRVERERDSLQQQLADSSSAAVATATPSAAPSKVTSYPVEEVEGIGKKYGKVIREMEITTTQEFLDKCCQMEGRIQVAEKVGIEDFVVGKWASMCDLMRVPGIRGQFAELMVYAGIDSVQDLAKQNPERLHNVLATSNEEQNRVRTVPGASSLESMINQAKTLNPVLKDL